MFQSDLMVQGENSAADSRLASKSALAVPHYQQRDLPVSLLDSDAFKARWFLVLVTFHPDNTPTKNGPWECFKWHLALIAEYGINAGATYDWFSFLPVSIQLLLPSGAIELWPVECSV